MAKPSEVTGLTARTPASEAAILWVGARLADVRHQEDLVRAGFGVDAVHDMRVASRRLRVALQLFDRKGTLAPVEGRVKALQAGLGALRDLHVQLPAFREALTKKKGTQRSALRQLMAQMERELSRRERALQALMKSWDKETVVDILEALDALKAKGTLGGHRVRRRVGKSLARVRRRAHDAKPTFAAAPVHRLRIAVKTLRYQLELVAPAMQGTAQLRRSIQPLQEALGRLHDADARATQLDEAARGDPALEEGSRLMKASLAHGRAARVRAVKSAVTTFEHTPLPRWLA
jgi:CHAD domain-containing protein